MRTAGRACPARVISYTIFSDDRAAGAQHPLAGQPPSKIIAVHVSYRSRAMERGRLPQWPSYFLKPPNTLAADGDAGAAAAVVRAARLRGRGGPGHRDPGQPGRRRRRLGPRALGHRRQRLRRLRPALRRQRVQRPVQGHRRVHARSARGCSTPGAVDPERIRLRTWVNGELAQDAVSGDDLLFSFADIVADISRLTTLEPGDVILTGTPTGSTVVRPGDLVEVEVSAGRHAAGTRDWPLSTGRLRSPVAEADYAPAAAGRDAGRGRRAARGRLRRPRRPAAQHHRPGRLPGRGAARRGLGQHRHPVVPAAQARLQRGHPGPAARHPAGPEDGRVRQDAALRAVPRGPVRPVRRDAARRRAERAEARRRAGAARRGPGHRGARRPDRGHRRRHTRAARPGARRGRHRHRRRDQGQPGAARHGPAGLLRRDAPGRARPAARAVGGERRHRLRRRHRHAGRHHRRATATGSS